MSLSSMIRMCAAIVAFITERSGVRGHSRARGRQRENDFGSPILHCFDSNAPTVPLDDAACDREPGAGPFELPLAMHALEQPEQLACVFHIESGTVVHDEIGALS